MAVSETCELGRVFRRCRRPAAGACQYCGRAFCPEHGQLLEGGQAICGRERCQRKRVDLEQHLAYKQAAAAANAYGRCGHPACDQRPAGQCSKCNALYCPEHLESRDDVVGRGYRAVSRRLSLCPHCWARRPLWARA